MQRPGTDDLAAWPLAALMVGSGVTHFTNPGYYRALVPSWLPARSGRRRLLLDWPAWTCLCCRR